MNNETILYDLKNVLIEIMELTGRICDVEKRLERWEALKDLNNCPQCDCEKEVLNEQ